MRKRKLYPAGQPDRLLVWAAIAEVVLGWGYVGSRYLLQGYLPSWFRLAVFLLAGPISYLVVFFAQDYKGGDSEREYTKVISDVGQMVKQLSALSEFLEKERTKVSESQVTL